MSYLARRTSRLNAVPAACRLKAAASITTHIAGIAPFATSSTAVGTIIDAHAIRLLQSKRTKSYLTKLYRNCLYRHSSLALYFSSDFPVIWWRMPQFFTYNIWINLVRLLLLKDRRHIIQCHFLLYTELNQTVFCKLLKGAVHLVHLSSQCSFFHIQRAATANALTPNFSLVLGKTKSPLDDVLSTVSDGKSAPQAFSMSDM